MHLNQDMQNNRTDQKAAINHTEGSLIKILSASLDLTLIMEIIFMIAHLTNLSKIS